MAEAKKLKKKDGRKSALFLLAGIAIVCALAYLKIEGKGTRYRIADSWREGYLSELSAPQARLAQPSIEVKVHGQRAFISERPVSRGEFFRFVQASHYRTWRERRGYRQNWRHPKAGESWEQQPEAPVSWLTPSDAVAYCQWFAKEVQDSEASPRLPTVAELEAAGLSEAELWEWTCETLYSHDSSKERNRDYYCAWRAGQEPLYRREQDLAWPDSEAAGFRLCW